MLPERRPVPEPTLGRSARVRVAHPILPVVGRPQVEMKAHLLLHLAIVAGAEQVVLEAEPQSAKPGDHRRVLEMNPTVRANVGSSGSAITVRAVCERFGRTAV